MSPCPTWQKCRNLAMAGNKGTHQRDTRSFYCLSPRWGGEEKGKKKVKLMGQDKGGLTEQQTK